MARSHKNKQRLAVPIRYIQIKHSPFSIYLHKNENEYLTQETEQTAAPESCDTAAETKFNDNQLKSQFASQSSEPVGNSETSEWRDGFYVESDSDQKDEVLHHFEYKILRW